MSRHWLFQILFILAIMIGVLNSGCSSFEKLMGQSDVPPEIIVDGEPVVRFSENNQYLNMSNRNYKRMTRSRLEEDSELHAQAGSMWVMEGQGAYLFAQNKTRREGDLLNVRVEGPAQKQVEMKVDVIKDLLKQLEAEEKKSQQPATEPGKVESQGLAEQRDDNKRAPASTGGEAEKSNAESVQSVPTRIIEKLGDGNYRVKGQQPFMIGQREYKIIVTGVVRPEDFNDEGISSNRLLDPQFDVVSLRRTEKK